MDHTIYRTSFNPITSPPESSSDDLLEQECRRILANSEPVELTEGDVPFAHLPYLAKLIMSIYAALVKKLPLGESIGEAVFSSNPLGTQQIKCSLLKLLASIIERKLFLFPESQRLYEEASFSLFFKNTLFPFLLAVLSHNSNFVPMDRLMAFFTTLHTEQYVLLLPLQFYHLYGGGLFTIQARVFREKLTLLVESLGRVLSASETVINRNIQDFKNNKERQVLLDESIRTAMLAKNKEDLSTAVARITEWLFGSKEYLQREEFIQLVSSRQIEPTLAIFLLLARSESTLFQQRSFRAALLLRSEISRSNFYASEMTKLFNKCPFNGDERCSCKKCQCVRRNRESAKLSQEKKRNAVEQLDTYKKRIAELEEGEKAKDRKIGEWESKYKKITKRNVQLQEEVLMLKSLLKEMKANPNIKQHMMQTIEPISKILNND